MKTTKSLIALAVGLSLVQGSALAQETLEKTKVGNDKSSQQVEKIDLLSTETVDDQLIGDIEDTVRYISGVSINDTGNRFGDNGFNIRGLEGDSVAILVDGLSQGESLDPINFSRYGMFSSTRNSVEIESVKSVEILKGANSVTAGSGALGGAVIYTTKDAADFFDSEQDDFGASFKLGYDGRSSEKLANIALAKRFGQLEALAIYTARKGNETKAHDDGLDIKGAGRGQANPFDSDKTNLLAKLLYKFNDNHQLGVVYEDYSREREGTPLSRESGGSYFDFKTDDESSRKRVGLFYNWHANNLLFDELEFKADKQEVNTHGITAFGFKDRRAGNILRTEDRAYEQNMDKFTLDLTKTVTGDIKHEINYGLSFEQTDVENRLFDIRYKGLTKDTGLLDGYPKVDPSWVPKTDKDSFVAYIHDKIQVTDKFTLFAGLRYDKTEYSPKVDATFADPTGNAVSDSEFSSVTGKFSAEYEFIPQHSVTFSVATGYKAPTTQELYLNTNGAGQFSDVRRVQDPATGNVAYVPTGRTETDLDTVANPNLDAEEGINFELAYQWQTEAGFLKVNLFRADYDNQIINVNHSSAPFAQPITNASFLWFLPSCRAQVTDACWNVSTITHDTWGVPTNTGETKVSGLEIDAAIYVTEQISLTLSHSQSEGEYTKTSGGNWKGDDLPSIAPDNTVVGITYDADQNWGLSAHIRFIDGKDQLQRNGTADFYTSNNNPAPLFYTQSAEVVDLFAYYDFNDSLTFRAGVTNLFDKNYSNWNRVRNVRKGSGGFFGGVDAEEVNGAIQSTGIQRYSEPGREFSASLTYNF